MKFIEYFEYAEGKLLGSYLHRPSGKWLAQKRINGKLISIGLFKTQQEAHNAYIQYKGVVN